MHRDSSPRNRTKAPLAERIADFAVGLHPGSLAEDVVVALRLAVLDCLAAIIAGIPQTVSRRIVDHVCRVAGEPRITVIGSPVGGTVEGAALANGTMAHACDFDDSSLSMWGHPTAPALPAVLAVGEMRNLSGREFLAALAVAIEVEKALGVGLQPEHYTAGWHPTGTLGVFGAAVGAAKALGLDKEQTVNAIGIAASRSAGIRANVGTMVKPLHVGFAARDGVEAALLAGMGITASPNALEGVDGFLQVYSPAHGDLDAIAESLGNPYEVIDPGLVYKLYPCCADLHASVDAILELRAEHGLDARSVRRIWCGITPLAQNNAPYARPATPNEAKFSQEYCLAAALVRGCLGLKEFRQDAVDDSAIREVLKRVDVELAPELAGEDSVSFSSPAIVEVETTDGRRLRKQVRDLKGHPNNPLSVEDLETKFFACAQDAFGEASMKRIVERVHELDDLVEIRALLAELVPSGSHTRRRE